MPLETDIPMEIDGYQKKVVFGLTLRQLVCIIAAVPLAVGAYFLCSGILHLSANGAGWVVMLIVCPLLAVGFIQPHGEPFERFFLRKLRRYFGANRLCYTAEPTPFFPETQPADEKTKQKGGIRHGPDPVARGAENTYRFRTGPGRKRRRKQTALRLKTAKKEHRQAEARAKRETQAAARS